MDNIIQEVFMVLHRFHQVKPKFKGDGSLGNVEFFMLLGLEMVLKLKSEEKNNQEKGTQQIEEQGITLGEIIKITEMSMSAASKKISILERKGLVKRTPSKVDRRNMYITLTELGKEICAREERKRHALVEELVKRMGEEDMKQLLILANKAFDVMDDMVKEQS